MLYLPYKAPSAHSDSHLPPFCLHIVYWRLRSVFYDIWEVLRTQELTGVYCSWENSKDLRHWNKLPPPCEHFSNPRGGTSSSPSIIFSHTVCMCSAFHHQLSVCREALERRWESLERIKSIHGRGAEQKRKEKNHPHKPKYILSNFHAESWQGKGVNKNEFTRTQFSHIYNNYGHRAFTWNLHTDDKFLRNHQWKMSVMVISSMACLKDI